MKIFCFKLYILFLYLISITHVYSIEHPNLKNLVLHKNPKKLDNVVFKNIKNNHIKLSDFKNKLVIINFWATWCLPCREEMPSLDKLQINSNLKNLKIIPINIGREKLSKSTKFFEEYDIKNLEVYYDSSLTLPKKLLLRGIPTTLLINKEGEEFARVVGSINFEDENLINWLKKYE